MHILGCHVHCALNLTSISCVDALTLGPSPKRGPSALLNDQWARASPVSSHVAGPRAELGAKAHLRCVAGGLDGVGAVEGAVLERHIQEVTLNRFAEAGETQLQAGRHSRASFSHAPRARVAPQRPSTASRACPTGCLTPPRGLWHAAQPVPGQMRARPTGDCTHGLRMALRHRYEWPLPQRLAAES